MQNEFDVSRIRPQLGGLSHLERLHGKIWPRLGGLPGLADRANRIVGSPHLSCKCDQIKMRDHMDRWVTPPERVTSPSWGPPPLCKQALIGRALALSEISKKMRCKSNHSSLSSVIIEAAFLRHKFTPGGKIFSVLIVNYSRTERAPTGRSSMNGFFPTTPKNTETDQNGLWRHLTLLALSFLRRISETDETLTRLAQSTHVYMCHAISFMSYDVSDLERFPISQEVMLFFLSRVRIFVFWIFSCTKFCVKPRKTLNGSQGTLLGSFLWLDVSSNK